MIVIFFLFFFLAIRLKSMLSERTVKTHSENKNEIVFGEFRMGTESMPGISCETRINYYYFRELFRSNHFIWVFG